MKQRITSRKYLSLRLKGLGYCKIEILCFYQSKLTRIMTYCSGVWGGAANYLLDNLNGFQLKTAKIGIIDDFNRIGQHIKECDHSFDEINDIGTAHPLLLFVSKRSVCAFKLCPKLLSV